LTQTHDGHLRHRDRSALWVITAEDADGSIAIVNEFAPFA